ESMLGYTPAEWIEDPNLWMSRIHPQDRDRVLEASEVANRSGAPFLEEYRISAWDGRLVWIRDESVIVDNDRGSGSRIVQGVMYDVTRQKEFEERLRAAEERFRTLVEQLPVVTYIEDTATDEVLYVSPQVEAMFGYTPAEWKSNPRLW